MFPVVAIIGPRQCGKSTLVRRLRPEWQYYDLESPDDYQLISSDPGRFLTLHPGELIFDEAQQYPELFRTLRGAIDADRGRKGRYLLTGSSSPEIVRGISESLAGRIATVELWPFKQSEFQETGIPDCYQRLLAKNADPRDFLNLKPVLPLPESLEIWRRGGFPEPLIAGAEQEGFYRQWMENYLINYVGRDIRQLFPRLNVHNFRRFLTLLAQFSGHQLNMSDIARTLEVSVSTVKDYLDIIHQTFLWRNLPPYTGNRLKKVQKAKKGFFRDQGLLHFFLRINDLDSLLLHPVAGFSFESFVTEEIIRGLQATMATQLEFSYYRTIDRSEVDLIIEGDFGTVPVEIKLGSVAKKAALRGLENFLADTGSPFGIVVNSGKRPELLTEKIVQLPVNYL
ncbi:ATP-binding protein [Desulfurivibrio dismutans]|uniref:ATP-binding protein n=1 Tax=Desulfurivibrio dismutans TaxID=1398908 RepID=UPI0023DB87E4|nr:ATP-binding protein [Desulfurivibrio alkaliphilus]MDF1614068.1 ATP-binding protein [Desulfurivibrio alkaliphilus]